MYFICIIKERFQADVLVISRWVDNSIETSKFDPKNNWKPEIYIENAVANTKQEITYNIEKLNGNTFILEYRTNSADNSVKLPNNSPLVSSAIADANEVNVA